MGSIRTRLSILAAVLVAGGVVVGPSRPAMAQPGSVEAVISRFTPASGSSSGDTIVTIIGYGLTGAVGVRFDGAPGTDFTINGAGTVIRVTTPPTPTFGPAPVEIVFQDGSVVSAPTFTYYPRAESPFPEQGPTAGGTRVAIFGNGLAETTGVTFGGIPGTDLVVDPSGTLLRVVTPPGAPGRARVTVLIPRAGDIEAFGLFTYRDPVPTASAIRPASGPQSGGQTVTITGTGFVPGTTVTFDRIPATNVVLAPGGTSLTAVTPAIAARPASVIVTTHGGSTPPLEYTYLADDDGATITGLTPPSGPTVGGTTVTITGTGFTGTTGVTFDGNPGTNLAVDPSGTSLTVVTPPGPAGPADVTVLVPGADPVAPNTFVYVDEGDSRLTPTFGPTSGGTQIRIIGTGLLSVTGVLFGGVPGLGRIIRYPGTSLTTRTPPSVAGPVRVQLVFQDGGIADVGTFTYLSPSIASVSPASGPRTGGTTITITGGGFAGATGVTFDGIPGTNLAVDTAGTSLAVVTPRGAAGPVDVRVLLPGPDALAPDGFRYLGPGPVIGTVDPPEGNTTGGPTVTIAGTGFLPGQTTIRTCGRTIPASQVTVARNGMSLTFRAPPCPAGDTVIIASTPNGDSNEFPFRYVGQDPSPPGQDPPVPDQHLPVTGSSVSPLVGSGSGAVLIGVLLLLLVRRRRGDRVSASAGSR